MYKNGVTEISLLHVRTGKTSIQTRSCHQKVVSTLHCALQNGVDVNDHQKIQHYRGKSTEESKGSKKKKKNQITIVYFAQSMRT